MHIEEFATVSKSKRDVSALHVTGTILEGQPGHTDYSSWTEKTLWSYNLANDTLQSETSQALIELFDHLDAGKGLDKPQMLDVRLHPNYEV
jgi:hypothetical protein